MVKFMASFFPNHLQARGAGALLVAALALALVWATPAGADSAFFLQDQQKFEDLAGSFLEAAPTRERERERIIFITHCKNNEPS